jgi:hypothetical protein
MYEEINNHDGSKTRSFTDLTASLIFARRMENLGFKTRFAANYLDYFEVWRYPVRYWREQPVETTFQDEASAAYADLRREGGYRNL